MLSIDSITYSVGSFSFGPLSLKVEDGEYLALLGPSGAGKSVLLELIAGLRQVSSGIIRCGRVDNLTDITFLPPQKRPVGLLFQDYALFPHLSVFENISYPMVVGGGHYSRKKIQEEVESLASGLEIMPLLERYPETLSGGEKQRVALARTLSTHPSVLLLDEPLSALDSSLRSSSLKLLKSLTDDGVLSVIHVTHDPAETVIADRILNL